MPVDRGQVWGVQYSAQERLVLTSQAKWDRRSLRPRWYWRLLTDEDVGSGVSPEPAYGETLRQHRRYAPPIGVYMALDPTGRIKGMKRGRPDENGNGSWGWSRAEAHRVGKLLGTTDDVRLSPGVAVDEKLYVPRPGDIFAHSRRLWEVLQTNTDRQDYIGQTDIVAVWSGSCHLFADDFVAPLEFTLPQPPTLEPAIGDKPRSVR